MRSAVKKGLRYETRVARAIRDWNASLEVPGRFLPGPWIQFQDASPGLHWAQPDIVVDFPNITLLLEAKLTQSDAAYLQLTGLYAPLLTHIFKKPVACVQVCRNLRYRQNMIRTPDEALINPNLVHVWHFTI